MIYDLNGNQLNYAYDVDGNVTTPIYDINGNVISNLLKVMSFNIQRFGGLNNASILSHIFDKYKPNIIGLQEYQDNSSIGGGVDTFLANWWDYKVVCDTTIEHFAKAICSNYQLSNHSTTYYDTQGIESRSYHKAYITYDNKTIAIYNTHLEWDYNVVQTDQVRVAQTQQLISDMSNETYFILLADTNCDISSSSSPQYSTIRQLYVDAGFNMANWGNFGYLATCTDGKTAESTWEHIDNIITSSNIDIISTIVDDYKISQSGGTYVIDHLPIVSILKVN